MPNIAIAAVGVAKQVDQNTVPANPTFWHGVSNGAMAGVEVTDQVLDVSTGLGADALAYRESAALPTGFNAPGFAKAIGLYLLGILGSVVTTGSGPYTHTFTMGSTIPWLAFYSKLDTWLQANGGSKLDEVSIEWDGPKPIKVTVVAQGSVFSLPVSLTPTNDESLGDYFTPVGGTFQGAVKGAVLAAMEVLGGKITLKRGLTVQYLCNSITPGAVDEAKLEAKVSLKVRAASFDDYRTIITGTANGTTISGDVVYGGFDVGFKAGAATLNFASSRVNFSCKHPEMSTKGGPLELPLEGSMLVADASSSPVTATLVNGVASY